MTSRLPPGGQWLPWFLYTRSPVPILISKTLGSRCHPHFMGANLGISLFPRYILLSVVLRVSTAVSKHYGQRQPGRKGVYSDYTSRQKATAEGGQGRNTEAGASAKAVEGCCFLACFPMACSGQSPQPRAGSTHSELSPPTSITG